MNNSYMVSFSTGIIYLFIMVLPNRDEVIQRYFKSGLSYDEILSVLLAHLHASLSIRQLKTILKKEFIAKKRQKA